MTRGKSQTKLAYRCNLSLDKDTFNWLARIAKERQSTVATVAREMMLVQWRVAKAAAEQQLQQQRAG